MKRVLQLAVTPAQAGVQETSEASWIPVFTGMTEMITFVRRENNDCRRKPE